MKEQDIKLTNEPYKVRCSHCGELRELRMPDVTVATHDFPVPCRSVCPGSGKSPLVPSIAEYTQADIDADRMNARSNGVMRPGWYAWDGPEGDEVISGPFASPRAAAKQYTEWREEE